MVGLASLLAREGELLRAVELIALALHHPATYHGDRVRAQELLAELESELSSEVLAAAIARGQARELDAVAEEILRGSAKEHSGQHHFGNGRSSGIMEA